MMHGFIKGVWLFHTNKNNVPEYNPSYMQSDFMCNAGPTYKSETETMVKSERWSI